nr:terminase gpA endonuclease subunit [Magnetospirillum sp. SS-4]
MLAAGVWRAMAVAEDPGTVGFHISALYSPPGWQSWESIARLWEAAQGSDDALRVFRNSVLVQQFCRPVWERFVRLAVLAGHLPAAGFDRDPSAFLACDWLPPKWDWVDPLKDARAEIEQIKAGLKSRGMSIAERGYDAEDVDAAIAADREREKRLGLTMEAPNG